MSLLAHLMVIFAVVQSPYGSLGFFDDSPSTTDWVLPMAAGVVVGLLLGLSFGTRVALVSSGLTMLLGLVTILFIYPTANCAIGSALGAAAAAALVRWARVPTHTGAAIVLLLVVCFSSGAYGLVDHTAEPLPSTNVLRSADGPSVLVDREERLKSTWITGTLADVDGCLGLVDASMGDGTLVVLWRLGTKVSSDPFSVTIEGEAHGLGDKVSVPGAGLLTMEKDLEAYRPDMPDSCAGHDLFL